MQGRTKALVGLGILTLAVAAAVVAAGWALFGDGGRAYVQVDNDRVSAIEPRGGMEYEYRLDAVDERGAKSEISFQTSRELRDGAYLELETKPLRGVVGWEEVDREELPAAVRDALPAE